MFFLVTKNHSSPSALSPCKLTRGHDLLLLARYLLSLHPLHPLHPTRAFAASAASAAAVVFLSYNLSVGHMRTDGDTFWFGFVG